MVPFTLVKENDHEANDLVLPEEGGLKSGLVVLPELFSAPRIRSSIEGALPVLLVEGGGGKVVLVLVDEDSFRFWSSRFLRSSSSIFRCCSAITDSCCLSA